MPGPLHAAGCITPQDILLDTCICSLALQSTLSPESKSKLAQGGQQQLLVAQVDVPPPAPARKPVPPGRGTEQPSGSSNTLDVLAQAQHSSVRAQRSGEVVPLSLLGAAMLAPTSSPLSLTQPGLGADTYKGSTPGQVASLHTTPGFEKVYYIMES